MKKLLILLILISTIFVGASFTGCDFGEGGNKTSGFTVTFIADGKEVAKEKYTAKDKDITVPQVPEKEGYSGAWEEYTLTVGNKVVKAIYTPINYSIRFLIDGEDVCELQTYSVVNKNITVPQVPEKEGYSGAWEEYDLDEYKDFVINAVYTPIEYTITFKADGVIVGEVQKYTCENKSIVVPNVPEKEGYLGAWEEFTLTSGNIVVNAVYTPKSEPPTPETYTVSFYADGELIDTCTYDKDALALTNEPSVPEKEHYTGVWGNYTLNNTNLIVNAVYTPIEYTITFKADGVIVGEIQKYTCENKNVVAPQVPEKEGYSGAWEEYSLDYADNKVVNAVYTQNQETTIKFNSTIIYNANGTKEYFSNAVLSQVPTYHDASAIAGSSVTLPSLSDFEINYSNGGSKTYKSLKWIYVDDKNVIHTDVVVDGKFNSTLFSGKTEVTLYMQYTTFESWTGNY